MTATAVADTAAVDPHRYLVLGTVTLATMLFAMTVTICCRKCRARCQQHRIKSLGR